MSRWLAFIQDHFLSVALVALAVGLLITRVARHGIRPWFNAATITAIALIAFVTGGWVVTYPQPMLHYGILAFPSDGAGWLAFLPWVAALGMLGWLIATGRWSTMAAWGMAGTLCFALGIIGLQPAQAATLETYRMLTSLEIVQPWWLLLLLLLPVIVWLGYGSLAGLGPVRRWLALGLRLFLVLMLILALAEVRVGKPNANVSVLFLVDRSLSIPQEIDPRRQSSTGDPIDARRLRIQNFINDAVQRRGLTHRNDQTGVILFARRPRLVMPPSAVDQLLVSEQMAGAMDVNYTDIAAAIKLGLASFGEDAGKRLVLVSDGNENLGRAEEQANLAKQNGVQIDTVLLAPGYRNENEVLVQAVEAPPMVAQGQRLPPIRVLLRNASPSKVVFGTLELLQIRDGRERQVPIIPGIGVDDAMRQPPLVRLRPGLNSFSFRDAEAARIGNPEEALSFTYRAQFTPLESADENGGVITAGLPGDRAENNKGRAHVVSRGQRRVLFLEASAAPPGEYAHQHLIDRLRQAKFTVVPLAVAQLPQNAADLGLMLADYDCIVIANVPSDLISDVQQEIIRSNVFDQGCGLVMVGGPDSYGAGGYQDSAIEKALPVDSQIKALKSAGRGGLVLIMHASEMADGNRWQKEIAKLAIKKLAPIDMVGMIYYGFNTQWHIPFQVVGEDRGRLMTLVDRMTPGDMPDFDPGLQMAYETLSNPDHQLVTKHVILISDGDASLGPNGIAAINKMPGENITCTTVGVATHGAPENARMQQIATTTKGKFYNVTDPSKLPAIYIREARRVSQSYLYDKKFQPKLLAQRGPTDTLDSALPPLFGFIRTTKKASPLAEMLIEGPSTFEQKFPVLASWQYGLGRSIAFTSDARTRPPTIQGWDREWAASDIYLKFWEQSITWAMRGVESGRLQMQTEYRDGRVRLRVDARDERNRPITDLRLEGGVTSPNGVGAAGIPIKIDFESKGGGIYEAEFKAEEAGSYFLNAVAKRDGQVVDSVRAGVTLPYSPEFADLESNTALMRRLSAITGGNVYEEDDAALSELARSAELYRPAPVVSRSLQPIWFWLLFIAAMGLLLDVGVRRISIEPAEVQFYASRLWRSLRHDGTRTANTSADYLARLKDRKAEAGNRIDRTTATRRFETTGETPTAAAPAGADEMPSVSPPAAPPRPTAPPPIAAPEESAFERLKRAKRRAQQQTDREDVDPVS